ncbi:hypothetical protein GCM10009733_032660 [Nonomuraea maheshkhaliensis]|uniref:Uncharacterized protein n=1 Tax=Nonomuraea maheshkhaliensis TaxID=419590 RepID=A0ABN2F703_9ACTN
MDRPARPIATSTQRAGHVRIDHARAYTLRQSLDTQLDVLQAPSVTHVFSEKISTARTR